MEGSPLSIPIIHSPLCMRKAGCLELSMRPSDACDLKHLRSWHILRHRLALFATLGYIGIWVRRESTAGGPHSVVPNNRAQQASIAPGHVGCYGYRHTAAWRHDVPSRPHVPLWKYGHRAYGFLLGYAFVYLFE